jgi:hypothetical protein
MLQDARYSGRSAYNQTQDLFPAFPESLAAVKFRQLSPESELFLSSNRAHYSFLEPFPGIKSEGGDRVRTGLIHDEVERVMNLKAQIA